MVVRLLTISVFILAIFMFPYTFPAAEESTASRETTLEEIIEQVKLQQAKTSKEVEDAVFSAEFVYRESKKGDELEKELVGRRRVYMRNDGKRHEEFLSMTLNGKELKGKDLEKQIKDWKKRAKSQQESKMPLTKEGEGAYDYRLVGDGTWNEIDVWIVGFSAKEKKDKYVNGTAYVSREEYNLVGLEFSPAKTSRVIKSMGMSLTYSEIQGHWMPVKFTMDMKIRIGLLVDMFYRHITVEDIYSDYKFNSQLADSVFGSDLD